MLKKQCPCCSNNTIDSEGHYDICPVCYWEDDPIQRNNVNYKGGANILSLEEAQKNYKKFKVSNLLYKKLSRPPYKNEIL